MIPFPGESLPIESAVNVGSDDWNIFYSIVQRGGQFGVPATVPFVAGDEWRAWVYPGTWSGMYLEDPATPVVVSWVVEVESGAGSFTAAMGLDPDYGDPTAPAPTGLGTHTVTGAGAVVIPTALTADDILNEPDAFMLSIVALSGSIEVRQIKMRVWPPGGPLGGYTLREGFNSNPLDPGAYYALFQRTGTGTGSTSEESWEPAALDILGEPVPTTLPFGSVSFVLDGDATDRHPVSSGGAQLLAGQTTTGVTPAVVSTTINLYAEVIIFRGVDWTTRVPVSPLLVDGVDYIRPPRRGPRRHPLLRPTPRRRLDRLGQRQRTRQGHRKDRATGRGHRPRRPARIPGDAAPHERLHRGRGRVGRWNPNNHPGVEGHRRNRRGTAHQWRVHRRDTLAHGSHRGSPVARVGLHRVRRATHRGRHRSPVRRRRPRRHVPPLADLRHHAALLGVGPERSSRHRAPPAAHATRRRTRHGLRARTLHRHPASINTPIRLALRPPARSSRKGPNPMPYTWRPPWN